MSPRPILVSACLLGLATRYDGTSRAHERVREWLRERDLLPIPVCPEQLGGLSTPRPPVCFSAGDGDAVLDGKGQLTDAAGAHVNEPFVKGAHAALEVAQLTGCSEALLKERSPSCGVHAVHRGDDLVEGRGDACALLRRNGLAVRSEEDL